MRSTLRRGHRSNRQFRFGKIVPQHFFHVSCVEKRARKRLPPAHEVALRLSESCECSARPHQLYDPPHVNLPDVEIGCRGTGVVSAQYSIASLRIRQRSVVADIDVQQRCDPDARKPEDSSCSISSAGYRNAPPSLSPPISRSANCLPGCQDDDCLARSADASLRNRRTRKRMLALQKPLSKLKPDSPITPHLPTLCNPDQRRDGKC